MDSSQFKKKKKKGCYGQLLNTGCWGADREVDPAHLEQPQAPLLAPFLGLVQQAAQLGSLLSQKTGRCSRPAQLGFVHLPKAPLQPSLLFSQKPCQPSKL